MIWPGNSGGIENCFEARTEDKLKFTHGFPRRSTVLNRCDCDVSATVFSPGGVGSAHKFTGIEFWFAVIEDSGRYPRKVPNQTLAIM